ncbi:MAG TPA: DUF4214 domain-containing protein [Pseudonocardiaceae bacterium]|nr:DUF4214 domain-containing protein [Pseudonocardiaceae bacterium]
MSAGVVAASAGLVLGLAPAVQASAATQAYVPAQFIAKLYTEALGRIPDQAGWQRAVGYFRQSGCTADTLAGYGEGLFESSEFTGLGYDHSAELVALYRGALNREPDPSGFAGWTQQLSSGLAWPTVVSKFFTSSEFGALVPLICSGAVDASASSYYFGTEPPMAVPTVGSGFAGTEKALQDLLNSTAAHGGGTVTLAQRALITLTTSLRIPAGVTLTTTGAPDARHYANMARLVRDPAYAKPTTVDGMVRVAAGATLSDIWVDGTRGAPDNTAPLDDVITYGGDTTVSGDRISDAQGPNSLYLFGGFNGYPCANETVSANLITAYSSDHYRTNDWTDGIADNCEDATIAGNQIVDSTDVAIVVYRNTANSPQHSAVRGNYVLSAGNSMYGGLGFDPLYEKGATPGTTFGFAGSSLTGNYFWSGPDTHFDIGLVDGSRAWFAARSGITADTGTGASITDNTTGTQSARVQTGVGIGGMVNTTVTGNSAAFQHITAGQCPKVDYAAEISAGHASGTITPVPTDINFDACV